MPKQAGFKQRQVGENVAIARPAVDERHHAVVQILALERGEAATLAYSRVLAAGLEALGWGHLLDCALQFGAVDDKEAKQRLRLELLAAAGLQEEAPMAS